MSKKPWRNPANPEYKSPALDTSIQHRQEQTQDAPVPPAPAAAPYVPTPADLEKARMVLGECERGSDGYALRQLLRTADFLDEFVQHARTALKQIAPEKLNAILNQVEVEPVASEPTKRPRGAMHPIMLLYKLAVGAAKLHQQVIKATNPSLFTLSPDKADAIGVARQSHDYIHKLNKAKAEWMLAVTAA